MKNISFAWTTQALLDGWKWATRRFWSDGYARRFHARDLVAAYDRQPRFRGKRVGTIELIKAPYRQSLYEMTQEDFVAEGGSWRDPRTGKGLWANLEEYQEAMLAQGKGEVVWVVAFELVERTQAGLDRTNWDRVRKGGT